MMTLSVLDSPGRQIGIHISERYLYFLSQLTDSTSYILLLSVCFEYTVQIILNISPSYLYSPSVQYR